MNTRFTRHCPVCKSTKFLALVCLTATLWRTQAEPLIISSIPTSGASGVSPSASVVFTFNEPMNPDVTLATFFDTSTFAELPTGHAWSSGNTVLTCAPSPPFPANKFIVWNVDGENPSGDFLGGSPSGFFTTGGSAGGSGTNAVTSFSVGKIHAYEQSSTTAPVLDPDVPYGFGATTTLASNRTANAVTLTLPNNSVSNLFHFPFQPETFSLFVGMTNLAAFDSAFAPGNYVFEVQASSSNQQVTVNLSAGLTQPAAPHVNNFTAAQAVNPAQAFQLGWDPFAGGTAADYIFVNVGELYKSPDLGKPGALTGTATSFSIPAGTLQSGSNYDVTIGFYRYAYSSNATYTTTAYRATTTHFTLLTSGGSVSTPLVLTNFGFAGGSFSLEVTSSVGQTLTVEYKTNLASGSWLLLQTTNSPGGRVRITYPQASTNRSLFFRARTGS